MKKAQGSTIGDAMKTRGTAEKEPVRIMPAPRGRHIVPAARIRAAVDRVVARRKKLLDAQT